MKVSVIVPTYHRPAFLAEALASVALQRYPPERFEVIVVHDGPDAARPCWAHPIPFRWVTQPHAGLSAAVNRGMEMARGEYLSILSDDDFLYPNKLRVLAEYLDAHPEADAVCSLPLYVDARGNSLGTPERSKRWLAANPVITWETVRRRRGLVFHGTGILYRTAMCRHAGPWDVTLTGAEEWEYHLRLLAMGYVFHGLSVVTTAYRIHPGQKSGRRHRRTAARLALRRLIDARYALRLREPAPRRADVAAHAE